MFKCCTLVQEISCVVHYLPWFGGGFLLWLFTRVSSLGVYFFALPLFSESGSVFHQPLLLSMCYDGLLFVFQFCRAVWVLLMAQEMSSMICYLPFFGEWLIAHPL
jgi:hypothetical protein